MVRKSFWIVYISLCLLFTGAGCAALNTAVENYKACKGDQVCMEEMKKAGEASYVVAKSASSSVPIPSVPEIIAVIVSNLVSFGYGVFHGKKKGG